jgi:uncharacterized protein (DUF1684 family)
LPATGRSTIPSSDEAPSELELADWRRRLQAVYQDVRGADDPALAHARWRARRDELFGGHPQSPLPADSPLRHGGLPYWPYDLALRWTLPLEPARVSAKHALDTGADGVTRLRQIGWITLPAPYDARLAVWWLEQYGGGLFVPLRDATAGHSTHGGGRHLLDTAKGADLGATDAGLIIDLNFLYHPSCRYDPRWVCPLAPPENTIDTPVHAGERLTA